MKKLSLLFLLILIAGCQSNPQGQTKDELEHPFIHTAYFWLKDGLLEEELNAFIADCEKLKEVETVRAFYSGSPANTSREVIENTYDFAVVFHFENLADQEYYQQHPLHLEMIEKHQDKWERVMVTDIEH